MVISDVRHNQMVVRGSTLMQVERVLAPRMVPMSSQEVWSELGRRGVQPKVAKDTFYRWLREWGKTGQLYMSEKRRGWFVQHYFLNRGGEYRQLSWLED